jgi:hypothetical protein
MMMTGTVGGAKATRTRIRLSVVEIGEGSQRDPLGFGAAPIATRERKAEYTVNDRLTATAKATLQLSADHKFK